MKVDFDALDLVDFVGPMHSTWDAMWFWQRGFGGSSTWDARWRSATIVLKFHVWLFMSSIDFCLEWNFFRVGFHVMLGFQNTIVPRVQV